MPPSAEKIHEVTHRKKGENSTSSQRWISWIFFRPTSVVPDPTGVSNVKPMKRSSILGVIPPEFVITLSASKMTSSPLLDQDNEIPTSALLLGSAQNRAMIGDSRFLPCSNQQFLFEILVTMMTNSGGTPPRTEDHFIGFMLDIRQGQG